jgi:hypothetical protein
MLISRIVIVQESTREVSVGDSPKATTSTGNREVFGYARFFDDDKFDLYYIRDPKDVKVCC